MSACCFDPVVAGAPAEVSFQRLSGWGSVLLQTLVIRKHP